MKKENIKNYYLNRKNELIEEAVLFQSTLEEMSYSYGELFYISGYFEKYARRFGLLKEFRNNGII